MNASATCDVRDSREDRGVDAASTRYRRFAVKKSLARAADEFSAGGDFVGILFGEAGGHGVRSHDLCVASFG